MPNTSPYALGPNGELNGSDILVQIEQIADSGVYITVGSQRGATFAETTGSINMDSKNSRLGYRNPGRYGSTVSLEAMYVPTNSGYAAMSLAMRNGEYVRLRRRQRGTNVEIAQCVITSLSESFPDQEAAVVSAEFELNGGWTPAV